MRAQHQQQQQQQTHSSRPTSRGPQQRSNSTGGIYSQHVASSNYGQRNHPVGGQTGAGGSSRSHNPAAAGPIVVASQERLIQNLKSQIEMLNKDLTVAKAGGIATEMDLPPAGSPATHAVVPLRGYHSSRSPLRAASEGGTVEFHAMPNNNNLGNGHSASALAANVGAGLTSEVALLRLRHADMEREFHAQTAQLRRQLEEAHTLLLESDVIDPRSLSGPKLVRRNPADARQRIASDKREREHSLEVVELQKDVGRLRSELQLRDQEVAAFRKEKEALVSDLIAAKDVGRNAVNESTIVQKQLNDVQHQFRLEQEQRHTLEDKLNALQRTQVADTTGNEEYEAKIRALTAQLSVAKCEAESAKMSENKWRSEIQSIAQQNADLARATELARDQAAATDRRLKDAQARLDDCDAQREFLQLTVDRMRVEETSSHAKQHQMENILKAEREQGRELEKRFNRALEDNESLLRVMRQRESDQERRDVDDTKMRAQAKYAIDTADALRKDNEQLRHAVADLTRRLETGINMEHTQRAIFEAIKKMEDAKTEMHGIMQKQMRVAQDVANCVSAMPKDQALQTPASRAAASFLAHSVESSPSATKQQ